MSKFDTYSKRFLIDEIISMQHNILYINPLWENIIFLSKINNIFESQNLTIPFLEFAENFPKILSKFVEEKNIREIWVINGPGTFTKMRVIILTINTIKISFPETIVKSVHFFDFFKDLPEKPLIEINAKEFLTNDDQNGEIFYDKNSLPDSDYIGYSTTEVRQTSTFKNFVDQWNEIEKIFKSKKSENFLTPIYIKPPHITHAKK